MESVKLVAVTKPIDETMNVEQFLAYVARVSNPKNQDNHLTASKLIKYLINHKHWSPFEMVHLVLEINCTRSIARQILRHKSFSFQEFSQRYAEVDQSMFTKVEARMQDITNRQNSIILDGENLFVNDIWNDLQDYHIKLAISDYKHAVDIGIAKEQARALLPEGLTMSRLYMAGSLRSWFHYCQLRMANGTQKEHQDIAKECWNIILTHFSVLNDIVHSDSVENVN